MTGTKRREASWESPTRNAHRKHREKIVKAVINRFNGTITGFYEDEELEIDTNPWQMAEWLLLEAQDAGHLETHLYVMGVNWLPTEGVWDDRPFVVFTSEGDKPRDAKTVKKRIKADLNVSRTTHGLVPTFHFATRKMEMLDPIDAVLDTVSLIQHSAQQVLENT